MWVAAAARRAVPVVVVFVVIFIAPAFFLFLSARSFLFLVFVLAFAQTMAVSVFVLRVVGGLVLVPGGFLFRRFRRLRDGGLRLGLDQLFRLGNRDDGLASGTADLLAGRGVRRLQLFVAS